MRGIVPFLNPLENSNNIFDDNFTCNFINWNRLVVILFTWTLFHAVCGPSEESLFDSIMALGRRQALNGDHVQWRTCAVLDEIR